MVFRSSTLCLTMPRSIPSLPLSQSTSAHFQGEALTNPQPKANADQRYGAEWVFQLAQEPLELVNRETARLPRTLGRASHRYQRNRVRLYRDKPAPHCIVPNGLQQPANVPATLGR